MRAPTATFISYRLGGADGVAVEAAKWEWALGSLGFQTRRVAGELDGGLRPDDVWLPFLAIDPVPGALPDPSALSAAVAGVDLVVVENLCSLPLNVEAARLTRDVLAAHTGRVCFHHHDFAWERPNLAEIDEFPPARPDSLQVTISEHARRDLVARGIDATVVPNSFAFGPPDGNREETRAALGCGDDDVVLLQPTRAIPRKNIGGGLEFARALATRLRPRSVRYWITGPAEDGYDAELARLLADPPVPVHVGRTGRAADAYAAADLVVFPSTWEGFGNPVVEAVAAERMVVVGSYPVLGEITVDLALLGLHDVDGAVEWLAHPDRSRIADNRDRAHARFGLEHLPRRISDAFAGVGWTTW